MTRSITEIKHRPGKNSQTWQCEVVGTGSGEIHIRYVSDRDYTVGETFLPAGTVTDAVYWSDRPYHVWRFTTPDGTVQGYRFDICTDTRFDDDMLEWTDLLLDLWIPMGGEPVWQDGEEFVQAAENGVLSPEQTRTAGRARSELDATWKDVIQETYGPVS